MDGLGDFVGQHGALAPLIDRVVAAGTRDHFNTANPDSARQVFAGPGFGAVGREGAS